MNTDVSLMVDYRGSTEICNNCRHFELLNTDNGLCRRHAPPAVTVEANDETNFGARFPGVCCRDWCGEFGAARIPPCIPPEYPQG